MKCDCKEECRRPIYAAFRINGEVYGLCPAHAAMMVMILARLACWYEALGMVKPEMMVLSQTQEPKVVV